MKAMLDLNVLMDVLQRREPFFSSAAAVCAWGEKKRTNTLAVPAHAVTTISYIVRKTAGADAEGKALDWILGNTDYSCSPVTAVQPSEFLAL